MPNKSVRIKDENEMQKLQRELLRKMTDEDVKHVCVRCGCTFGPRNDRIICPFCGLEYVPAIE